MNGKLIAVAAAALAAGGGGAALAATQPWNPRQESKAVIDNAAKRLGVQPSALSDALRKALESRVDAAVAAGRLTKEEGDAIKQRIESGPLPLFGGPPRGGFEHHRFLRGLDAAASYLGLSESDLRSQLESGKTLAQVAKDRGKSVVGLVQALVADAKKHLDEAVSAGRLTQAQEGSILANAKQRITALVNGRLPARPHFRGRFGPPPRGPGDGHGRWGRST